jgi:uncharacterized protein (DUF111 family)
VEVHVRGLKSLANDAYGALLTPLMMKKFLPEFRVMISCKMTGKEKEFHSILEALLEETDAGDRQNPPHRARREYSSSTALSTKCCYCNETHEFSACKNVTLVDRS